MKDVALDGSIAHWEQIYEGLETHICTDYCPLCRAYYNEGMCSGCPVDKYLGQCCRSNDNPWGVVREGLDHNNIPSEKLDEKREDIGMMLMCLYLLKEIVKEDEG